MNKDNTKDTVALNTSIFGCAVTTEQGCEEFLLQELKDRFKVDGKLGENWVSFDASAQQLCEIMYMSQLSKRLIITIAQGTFEDLDDLEAQFNNLSNDKLDLLSSILKEKTSRVACDRSGAHDFNSLEAEHLASKALKEQLAKKQVDYKISLDKPNVIIYIRIIDNQYIMGIDCAGRELSKRQHLVFNNANAIKGTTSFAALLYAGYRSGMHIIDPFSLSGNICIEAALYESGMSLNFYTKKFTLLDLPMFAPILEDVMKKADSKIKGSYSKPRILSSDAQFNNVAAQKKNAKIAGIDKYIAFSRTDIADLDIKTIQVEVDVVCTRVIEPSSNIPENKVKPIYSKLFENLKFITTKKTSFIFVVRNPELLEAEAELQNYDIIERKQVWQGQQPYFFVKMKRLD